ncbi:MAG: hypothetical protein J4215_00165 [Candidatus Diapherotrites archaeon]|uniref:Uncharacterized protein n=1 Tax=Candidatus Iainarchaeum sp. TaxID=3101447 RepID=A0A8T4L0X4_9ARCH|nr:hypothetical protein [Candidatus Diapherotrites archaeon]
MDSFGLCRSADRSPVQIAKLCQDHSIYMTIQHQSPNYFAAWISKPSISPRIQRQKAKKKK